MEVRSISAAIHSGIPSIGKMKTVYGDTEVNAVVASMVIGFVKFVNVGKTMNAEQVTETTKLLRQYFPHFNLADLKLFFEKMKMGYYGQFYDRLDGQLILSKMEEYNQERMNEFESAKSEEHNRLKREEKQVQSFHPTVIEALKKVVGEKKILQSTPKEPRTPTDAELFHRRALKQFDNLFTRFGLNIFVRALKIGNTVFTMDTFIERKVNNFINRK